MYSQLFSNVDSRFTSGMELVHTGIHPRSDTHCTWPDPSRRFSSRRDRIVSECLVVCLSTNAHDGFGTMRQLSRTIRAVSGSILKNSFRESGTVPNRWMCSDTTLSCALRPQQLTPSASSTIMKYWVHSEGGSGYQTKPTSSTRHLAKSQQRVQATETPENFRFSFSHSLAEPRSV